MFKELSALNLFSTTYDRYSLETVLNLLKDQYPNTAMECNSLLTLLKKSETRESVEYVYEDVSEETSESKSESRESTADKVKPSTEILPTETSPKKVTPPAETPTKKVMPLQKVAPPVKETPPVQVKPTPNSKSKDDVTKPKLTTSHSRSLGSIPTKPEFKTNTDGMNPNIQPNTSKLDKPNNKRTVVEETTKKKQKIEYVISTEYSTEEDFSSEESLEEKVPEKTQTQIQKNNNKAVQNPQPIKK